MRIGGDFQVTLGLLKRMAITNVDNWVYARRLDWAGSLGSRSDRGFLLRQRLGNSGIDVEISRIKPDPGWQFNQRLGNRNGGSSRPCTDLSWKRVADRSDLGGLEEERKLEYLMGEGCTIHLARWKGLLAGRYVSCKLSRFKPYSYNCHNLFSGKDAYYIFFCRTYDPFRGKGIFPEMLFQICNDIWRDDPQGCVYISARIDNPASQKGIEKAGFERIGQLRYLSIMKHPIISSLSIEERQYGGFHQRL